jgi:hypothetical protein
VSNTVKERTFDPSRDILSFFYSLRLSIGGL